MCGRTAFYATTENKRYNMSPTNSQTVLTKEGPKTMKWGLPLTHLLVNTRDDSKALLKLKNSNRCLVPSNGFYEWKNELGQKQPYYIVADDLFHIGAVYQIINGEYYYCLITTNVSKKLEFIHNRMPVLVQKSDFDEWFSPKPFSQLTSIVKPVEDGYSYYPVSKYVSNSRNEGPECIEELKLEVKQMVKSSPSKPSANDFLKKFENGKGTEQPKDAKEPLTETKGAKRELEFEGLSTPTKKPKPATKSPKGQSKITSFFKKIY